MKVLKNKKYGTIKLSQEQTKEMERNIKEDLIKVMFSIKGRKKHQHNNFETMFKEELDTNQQGFFKKVNSIIREFEKVLEADEYSFVLRLQQKFDDLGHKQIDDLYKRLFLIEERVILIEKQISSQISENHIGKKQNP